MTNGKYRTKTSQASRLLSRQWEDGASALRSVILHALAGVSMWSRLVPPGPVKLNRTLFDSQQLKISILPLLYQGWRLQSVRNSVGASVSCSEWQVNRCQPPRAPQPTSAGHHCLVASRIESRTSFGNLHTLATYFDTYRPYIIRGTMVQQLLVLVTADRRSGMLLLVVRLVRMRG